MTLIRSLFASANHALRRRHDAKQWRTHGYSDSQFTTPVAAASAHHHSHMGQR